MPIQVRFRRNMIFCLQTGHSGDITMSLFASYLHIWQESCLLKNVSGIILEHTLRCHGQDAANRLGVGVTTLRGVCRANQLSRWPYRKCKSLNNLIDLTRQVLDDRSGQNDVEKLAAVQVLEKQKQLLQVGLPCMSCLFA